MTHSLFTSTLLLVAALAFLNPAWAYVIYHKPSPRAELYTSNNGVINNANPQTSMSMSIKIIVSGLIMLVFAGLFVAYFTISNRRANARDLEAAKALAARGGHIVDGQYSQREMKDGTGYGKYVSNDDLGVPALAYNQGGNRNLRPLFLEKGPTTPAPAYTKQA